MRTEREHRLPKEEGEDSATGLPVFNQNSKGSMEGREVGSAPEKILNTNFFLRTPYGARPG